MIDFDSQEYKAVDFAIQSYRNDNVSWDIIRTEEKYKDALAILHFGCNSEILYDEWVQIVDYQKMNEEIGDDVSIVIPSSFIHGENPGIHNDFKLNTCRGSAWYSYLKKLREKKFSETSIKDITMSASRILNNLSLDTRASGAVKGLVIGNVQSGKTANMAALMAMAADQGWNFFIVLSGTIENLRQQTQKRLVSDLGDASNVIWIGLDNDFSSKQSLNELQYLKLSCDSRQRYLTVCLKNSSRLYNLLNWLRKDLKNREKLKILLIDDEADQASINTNTKKIIKDDCTDANINFEYDRTKINKSIVNLLNNKDENGEDVPSKFNAINYVAYTATPYANILNESPNEDSIYPSNFVASLKVPNTYIGPQHVFGVEGTDFDGLDIINIIPKTEKDLFVNINDKNFELPEELKKSILWFYCCFAIQKKRQIYKPVSMLIHVSQLKGYHAVIGELVTKWLSNLELLEFLGKCKDVYHEQINKFTKKDFLDGYNDYGVENIENYPNFNEFTNELAFIFNCGLSSIKINEKGEIEYSSGVHLCIDNSDHNKIEKNEYIRLLYPPNDLKKTTGFIVIGGATLSRGLTIEGLVSTYFLRTVGQADTLMQMGRWFGYRTGYEILPRIWMTQDTKRKFEFLSLLDFDLRKEMKTMEDYDIHPSTVGIKVRTYPNRSFLAITSRNKMKAAKKVNIDYTGSITQTINFYSQENILKENLDRTIKFVQQLPILEDYKNITSDNSLLWSNVDNKIVLEYIKDMKYPQNTATYINNEFFEEWFNKYNEKQKFNKWNVVLSSIKRSDKEKYINVAGYTIGKANRSKKVTQYDDGIIRIGALRAIKDLYVDVDIHNPKLSSDDLKIISTSKSTHYRNIRSKAGLGKTPLMIIYIIDKDSIARKDDKKRESMNTNVDVVGLSILIPDIDGKYKNNYVSVKLPDNFDIDNCEEINYEN